MKYAAPDKGFYDLADHSEKWVCTGDAVFEFRTELKQVREHPLPENMRGKAIAKLGFDYAAVKALKPDIVYTNCYGYSRRGPDGDKPAYDDTIEDDEVIRVGDLRIRCIHTPGHTPGSTSFLIEGTPLLLTGDTLFPGGVGNTSWDYSSFEQIIGSVDRRLMTLPPETLVLPGHGLDTTIGTERPHLDEWVARGW